MSPAARLQAVIDILGMIEQEARPADALISAYFRGHRYIGAKDRTSVAETAYGILRHRARLSWWCGHYGASPSPRLLTIAYLRLVLDEKEAPTAAYFSGARFAPDMLGMEEEKFLGKLKGHDLLHPRMPVHVRVECPEDLWPLFEAQFGARCEEELEALCAPAPFDLRVNQVKANRDDVIRELAEAGLSAKPSRYAPYGLRLGARAALPTLAAFKEGRVEIQDEGSQLAALLADARPGMRVADFCAGAGGKTLAMAAAMANKGRVSACDVLGKRLERATERFRRAGLHNIETRTLAAESDPWVKRQKGAFDRVLADAPCSGTGTWRRNPDARWKKLGPGLAELLPLQARILASAARLVKPGGRLIYATCSLLAEENQQQVETFLAAHEDFTLMPYSEVWREVASAPPPCEGDVMRLTPAQHGTDGFFTAIMARKEAPEAPAAAG